MTPLPSKDQIRQWVTDNPGLTSKRDIAKAFGLKGDQRAELRRLLAELEEDGSLQKSARRFRPKGELPPVALLRVLKPDAAGDLFAEPMEEGVDAHAGRILIIAKRGDPTLGEGDRILARLARVDLDDYTWEARLIRRIGSNPLKVLGIFRKGSEGGRILPIDKGQDKEWRVGADSDMGARDGELVEAEAIGNRRLGLPQARITDRLGDPTGPRAVSLIAIHQHGIPDQFPDAAIAEAEAIGNRRLGLPQARITDRLGDPTGPRAVSLIAIHQHGIPDQFPDAAIAEADNPRPVTLQNREDLRDIPLVTIDPADARDRDDAVFAAADTEPGNPGGHVLWIAIADVAHYVRPGGALDREARRRGNSTYFPDRVVPMLPDILSGDLCSLHDHADRPCLAVRIRIDAQGHKISHRFHRGLMRSRASLEYGQVQRAVDGDPDEKTAPLVETVLKPLFAAYRALLMAREMRQPLNLDLPERQIVLSDDGKVVSVDFKERLDAHRLIEEFMVLANVAAAEELQRLKQPLLYRVHEEPSPDKLDSLREVAEASGFTLAKGQVLKTAHLNRLLAQAEGSDYDELLNITTLRSMTQAYYDPRNFGHFGLALKDYAHFTSPIRRYSDLIVHRALIRGHGWGDDGLSPADIENLPDTGKLISDAERRSMAAERDTVDRYLAAYLSDRVGATFTGRVSGVQRFGLFIKLDETGADGLVPIREVGREFFHYDPDSQTLMGADTGLTIGIGARVTVRLREAIPVTGGLILELLEIDAKALPGGRPSRGKAPRRAAARADRGADKAGAKRRVVRKRR